MANIDDNGVAEQGGIRAHRRKIFISYRRADSQAYAGRLADELRRYFGTERVYRDIDSNHPSAKYAQLIDEALFQSQVVIVVIGPRWSTCVGPDGGRRLNNPDDLVRLEVERALMSGVAIVPVFVAGATMPTAAELPPSLQSLSRLQGQRLSDEDWRYDLGRVLEALSNRGVLPVTNGDAEGRPGILAKAKQATAAVQRYERSMRTPRRGAYDAVVGAVELLRYPRTEDDPEGAQVRFAVNWRQVTAKVLDAGPGRSKVVVELTSIKTSAIGAAGASVMVVGIGAVALLAGVGVRAMDRRFAVGFLDNVQRVLEGKGIGEDSALMPGMERWRKRSREF